jgi:hypothetical protein
MTDTAVGFESRMLFEANVIDGEVARRQNGVAGFDQYTEINTLAYPATG